MCAKSPPCLSSLTDTFSFCSARLPTQVALHPRCASIVGDNQTLKMTPATKSKRSHKRIHLHAAPAAGSEARILLSEDGVGSTVDPFLQLQVQMVQEVAHELVGILLLVAP